MAKGGLSDTNSDKQTDKMNKRLLLQQLEQDRLSKLVDASVNCSLYEPMLGSTQIFLKQT